MSIQGRRKIAIHEFRDTVSELVREVCETGEGVVITVDGEAAAFLSPIDEDLRAQLKVEDDARWQRLTDLAEEISAAWTSDLNAVDAVQEQRQ